MFCAAVRYGRVPKRSLSADDQSLSTSESLEMQPTGSAESTAATLSPEDATPSTGVETEEDIAAFESRQLAVFDVILSVAHSHTVHCDTTEDKVAALAKKPASLVTAGFLCVTLCACKCFLFARIADVWVTSSWKSWRVSCKFEFQFDHHQLSYDMSSPKLASSIRTYCTVIFCL